MEQEIWSIFATLNIGTAIRGLSGLFAIWLSARFASVLMDKGATMLGKIIVSVFGLCAVAMNVLFLMQAQAVYINTTRAFVALRDSGAEISANATSFANTYSASEPALSNTPVFSVMLLSALAIILVPMWFPNKK